MKNLSIAAALLALFCSAPLLRAQDAPAADPKRAAAAEELLKAMHVDEMMTAQKENMKKMMANLLPKTLSPEELKRAQAAQAAGLDAVFQQLTWETLKPDFIQIYSEVYTEDELKQLAAFYESPIGQKFVQKMPELQEKAAQIVQKRIVPLMPAIQAAVRDAMEKAKAADDSAAPATPASPQ